MVDGRLASVAHFRVEWGGPFEGFSRVEFSPFAADGGVVDLTRAVDGSKALMDWLRVAPKEKGGRRLVVTACNVAGEPVASYVLDGCKPLTLTLSAMDALESGPLTETLAVAFDGVRMAV